MQIVINLPDRMWERVKEGYVPLGISKHLKKGTPLPNGHGRLIDADRLKSLYSINSANFNTVAGIKKWIDDAHTIIEADKEE